MHTDKPKGYAFIEYSDTQSAEIAYKRADGKRIDGKNVLVDKELARIDRRWLPRRLGGGKGGETRRGTKESQDFVRQIKNELRKEQADKQLE